MIPVCNLCGEPHWFDTSVPSEVWNRVIRDRELPEFLCLNCIVWVFADAGEPLTATLYGDGFDGHTITMELPHDE